MRGIMKRFVQTWWACAIILPILAGLPGSTGAKASGQIPQVDSVYLMPMGNGYEQYLANHLTQEGVVRVVTEFQRADAVFTDRLGPEFERALKELAGKPATVEAESEGAKASSEEEIKPAGRSASSGSAAAGARVPTTVRTDGAAKPVSTFSRGRGNVFLVDPKTHVVLWSTFERPKNTLPREMDRSAKRVVERLRKNFRGR
jgi:hypothetical protein